MAYGKGHSQFQSLQSRTKLTVNGKNQEEKTPLNIAEEKAKTSEEVAKYIKIQSEINNYNRSKPSKKNQNPKPAPSSEEQSIRSSSSTSLPKQTQSSSSSLGKAHMQSDSSSTKQLSQRQAELQCSEAKPSRFSFGIIIYLTCLVTVVAFLCYQYFKMLRKDR